MLLIFAPTVLVALSVSQQFISAWHGPPPLITVYCGHQALVSHYLLWTAWANKFLDMGPAFGLSASLAPGQPRQHQWLQE